MNKPRNIPDEFKQGWDPMEEREHPAQTKALTKERDKVYEKKQKLRIWPLMVLNAKLKLNMLSKCNGRLCKKLTS